jgi:hypothetical protein
MSTPLICSALGVSPDRWPPDHYALLGLTLGDVDAATVEERVLARMERLRQYQLAHPDAVTDAMNRLAQALVCLTDPAAKRAYDASLKPRSVTAMANPPAEEFDGQYDLAPPELIAEAPILRLPQGSRPSPLESRPRRPWHASGDARRQLYRRRALVRRLLHSWREVGDYLSDQSARLSPAEAIEFVGSLIDVRERLAEVEGFALPGQPGAVVAGLARQQLPLFTFRHLLVEQRSALTADWLAGETRLAAIHRDLLRGAHRRRRRASWNAARRIGRALVTDSLDLTMFVLGLAALGLAIWRTR